MSRKENFLSIFPFHCETNTWVPGVDIIRKEHERVFLIIEKTKGVINIAIISVKIQLFFSATQKEAYHTTGYDIYKEFSGA